MILANLTLHFGQVIAFRYSKVFDSLNDWKDNFMRTCAHVHLWNFDTVDSRLRKQHFYNWIFVFNSPFAYRQHKVYLDDCAEAGSTYWRAHVHERAEKKARGKARGRGRIEWSNVRSREFIIRTKLFKRRPRLDGNFPGENRSFKHFIMKITEVSAGIVAPWIVRFQQSLLMTINVGVFIAMVEEYVAFIFKIFVPNFCVPQ